MKIYPGTWTMTNFRNEAGTRTTHVKLHADEYLHDGFICNTVVVSFATTEWSVDVEVLAADDGRIVSTVPLEGALEQDDLLLAAARGIAQEVTSGAA